MRERIRFFDELAVRWDERSGSARLVQVVQAGLAAMCIRPEEHVVDVGCGTGILSRCLLEVLGGQGRVYAVDISRRMLAQARAKIRDPRVCFVASCAWSLPLVRGSVDRVVCFSCWPHIDQPELALAEFARVLRPNGVLSIWHADGRERINAIHRNAGSAVADDQLAPAEVVAESLRRCGFLVYEAVDGSTEYRLSATLATGCAS